MRTLDIAPARQAQVQHYIDWREAEGGIAKSLDLQLLGMHGDKSGGSCYRFHIEGGCALQSIGTQ